jgi:hypothetical protein
MTASHGLTLSTEHRRVVNYAVLVCGIDPNHALAVSAVEVRYRLAG